VTVAKLGRSSRSGPRFAALRQVLGQVVGPTFFILAIATLVFVAGHILASVLGLAIGYYLLCWLNPQMNFLELKLPGLVREEPGPFSPFGPATGD